MEFALKLHFYSSYLLEEHLVLHFNWITCAIIRDSRKVSLGVKLDGLVSGVIAGHVAFPTVYAHFLQTMIIILMRNIQD